jgi:hypothetical protein
MLSFAKAIFFASILFCCVGNAKAQDTIASKFKIAVFSPIYIDSAFNGQTYKIWKNEIPKNMISGLDFYNGIMAAIDSLNQAQLANLEVTIYDSKSSKQSINSIVTNPNFKNTNLIIASFNSKNDIKTLADYAAINKVPLVSATFPNDGGVLNNPYFYLINPTLKAHCTGIYKYLQTNYATDNIVFLNRNGGLEEMLAANFKLLDSTTKAVPLYLEATTLVDSFSTSILKLMLDTTKTNVIVCATLNETFTNRVIAALTQLKKYKSVVIGMPTLESLKLKKKGKDNDNNDEVVAPKKAVPQDVLPTIIYSTCYNYISKASFISKLNLKYKKQFNKMPTDMYYKGYEMMLRFGQMIAQSDFSIDLSNNQYAVFNDFNFVPFYNKINADQIDFYENNKLYFITKENGIFKSIK